MAPLPARGITQAGSLMPEIEAKLSVDVDRVTLPSESATVASSRTAGVGAVVLAVTDVSKRFHAGPPWRRRRIDVLDGLSLDVRAGELVGLVGENGSGKSTLMQVIVGLVGRDSGSIDRPERLGYCPQLPLLWD